VLVFYDIKPHFPSKTCMVATIAPTVDFTVITSMIIQVVKQMVTNYTYQKGLSTCPPTHTHTLFNVN